MASTPSGTPPSPKNKFADTLVRVSTTLTQPLIPLLEKIVGRGIIRSEDRPTIALAVILVIILGIVVVAPPQNENVRWVLVIFLILTVPLMWGKFILDLRRVEAERNANLPQPTAPAPPVKPAASARSTRQQLVMEATNGGKISEPTMKTEGGEGPDMTMRAGDKGEIVKASMDHSAVPSSTSEKQSDDEPL